MPLYVPPHLRNKQPALSTSSVESPPACLRNKLTALSTSSVDGPPVEPQFNKLYSRNDLSSLFDCTVGALKSITVSPRGSTRIIAFILHDEQHPDWPSSHKLLCKSNLHAIHSTFDHETSRYVGEETEYPVFSESPFFENGIKLRRYYGRLEGPLNFEFIGWWRIVHVQMLEPHSKELIDQFGKKFNGQPSSPGSAESNDIAYQQQQDPVQRTGAAWKGCLYRQWAVLTMEENESRTELSKSSAYKTAKEVSAETSPQEQS